MTPQERSNTILFECHQAQRKVQEALSEFQILRVKFTRHDREVLRHIARGESLKQIAGELEITPNTASTHVRLLCRKAGVDSHEQLLVYTMQQPAALQPGAECVRGIHVVDPVCPCPHCRAILAA